MDSPGVPWWQVMGGLIAVFGLLIVFLKLLARLPRAGNGARAGLLAVWPVGPRREVQVLRLRDEVHYLYRQEGALVHLRRESYAEWQSSTPSADPNPVATAPWQRALSLLRPGRRAWPL